MSSVPRLNDIFSPSNYDLTLRICDQDFHENRSFSGQVTITGELKKDREIVLHAKDLEIISAAICSGESGDKPKTPAQIKQGEFDALILSLEGIKPGKYNISIEFRGKITDAMHGLYPCYYNQNDSRKHIFATQFESHHAREVFPCVDEPEAKATYNLTLITDPNKTVLSNMPAQSAEDQKNGLTRTVFETSPRMSSYLLAFVIGDLQKTSTKTDSGVEVNIFASPVQSPQSLTWALEHSRKTIEFFDEYFGVPYPLPKSDQVALPDFSSGAMENWGLITYRESALLVDPKTSTIADKRYVSTVISHELSHQWFGNLVTMKWWNNLWLNESFANMMEYLAIDGLYHDWHIWNDFCNQESAFALRRDAISGVQPVQTEVNHPDEISTLFDPAIVYAKGGRLLYMLMNWLGEDDFRSGLQSYFKQFAYGNTESNDLWEALSKASGKDVAELMNHWITTPGYPVVKVSRSKDSVTLQQKQFFLDGKSSSDVLWQIPLHANHSAFPELFQAKEYTINGIKSDEFIQINCGHTGHFIVQYDSLSLKMLLQKVRAKELSATDRSMLLQHQLLLAQSGSISSAELLELLDACQDEENDQVWDAMTQIIAHLKLFVEPDTPEELALHKFVGKLAKHNYERLGWQAQKNEPETNTKLRSTILACMAYSQDSETIQTALQLFDANDIQQLDSELRSLVLEIAVRHHKKRAEIVKNLWDIHNLTPSVDLRADIRSAITNSHDTKNINEAIQNLTDTSMIRTQDTQIWFILLLRNRWARDKAWLWLRDNWAWVEQNFRGDKTIDYFPRYTGAVLASQKHLDEYVEFFEPLQSDPALSRAITLGINEISVRLTMIERDKAAISHYLLHS